MGAWGVRFTWLDHASKSVKDIELLTTVHACSPYQAVIGKIYRLKQHFLPPATALRFTKIK